MRIAILTRRHSRDAFGGAEYRMGLIAQGLARFGHEVCYVCTSPCTAEWYADAVHVIPIPIRTFSRKLGRNDFLYYSDVSRVLDRIRPDVIYQSVASALTGIAALYARKNGCRMVWHVASERDVRPQRSGSVHSALFDYIDRRWTEYGIRSCDAIIGQARYQDRLLERYYGRHCDLIVGTPQPIAAESIIKTEPVTVVWVANLKPMKQPEVFLRLVRTLGTHRDVRFLMIGRPARGAYQRRLDRSIAGLKNFSYLAERPIGEVNQILAAAHVLVNTSQYEGFPNTFIQAWSRRVPVVSLNVDPDDVLKVHGLGFHSVSFEGLVRDVKRLVEDSALREAIGRRAVTYAKRHHSMDSNMVRIASLLANTNQASVL